MFLPYSQHEYYPTDYMHLNELMRRGWKGIMEYTVRHKSKIAEAIALMMAEEEGKTGAKRPECFNHASEVDFYV